MFTRRAKAYSSSCSQTVNLQPFRCSSFLKCALQPKIAKINKKNSYFGRLGSFKLVDVDTTRKLVTSACCDEATCPCLSATVFTKDWATTVK